MSDSKMLTPESSDTKLVKNRSVKNKSVKNKPVEKDVDGVHLFVLAILFLAVIAACICV